MGLWDFPDVESLGRIAIGDPSASAQDIYGRAERGLGGGSGVGGYKEAGRAQSALIKQLQLAASGQGGPSAAELLLNRGANQAMGGALGVARSSRTSPLLALRMAQQTQEQLGGKAAEDAAILRAQEQMQARQELANVIAQQRGAAGEEQKNRMSVLGSGIQGGGAALGAMLSDRRAKKSMRDASPDAVDAFLASISPKLFRYRDQGDEEPLRLGVLSQDAQRTPPGRAMTRVLGNGMGAIDVEQGLGAALASLAALRDRIAKLESAIEGPRRKVA